MVLLLARSLHVARRIVSALWMMFCAYVLFNGSAYAFEVLGTSSSRGMNFGQSESSFARLVRYVETATAGERLDFAHYAILQMALEHEEALAVAVHQGAKTAKKLAKKRRWISATRDYLTTLAVFSDTLGLLDDVPVYAAQAGAPTSIVEGTPILVSSLDARAPEQLGDAIVAAFCRSWRCGFLAESTDADSAISALQFPSPPRNKFLRWAFGDGAYAVLQTGDGLNFMFKNVTDRVRKEQLCVALSNELQDLAERLEQLSTAGFEIDWGRLRIEDNADHQKVFVDGAQSFVRLNLPVLSQARRVLRIAGPWLQARVRGEQATQFFPSADLLLGGVVTRQNSTLFVKTLAVAL